MSYLEQIGQLGTHRLVPSRYSQGTVLEDLKLPAEVIADLSELDAATNERKVAELGGLIGIAPNELLFGVPHAEIVNAAFCHPSPFGGRFNGAERGAWYAAFELETAAAEVSFHKRKFLRDAHIAGEQTFEYVDFLADFSGEFHRLNERELRYCLEPSPVPQCYARSQLVANALLYSASNGLVYPSVRKAGGTCIACFRPALVFHPRRSETYSLTMRGDEESVLVAEA